jgi:hypothetical protein
MIRDFVIRVLKRVGINILEMSKDKGYVIFTDMDDESALQFVEWLKEQDINAVVINDCKSVKIAEVTYGKNIVS